MNYDQFWKTVERACGSDPRTAEDWDKRLTELLSRLPAEEILEWDHIFDELSVRAYRTDLWAAAYIINGGASDDGFYYFRCWLIGMGRRIYEDAIAQPDSLADVVSPEWLAQGIDAEAEIYAVGHRAWMQVTGLTDTADYPVRTESAELIGVDWDYEDPEAMRQKLPRLTALLN